MIDPSEICDGILASILADKKCLSRVPLDDLCRVFTSFKTICPSINRPKIVVYPSRYTCLNDDDLVAHFRVLNFSKITDEHLILTMESIWDQLWVHMFENQFDSVCSEVRDILASEIIQTSHYIVTNIKNAIDELRTAHGAQIEAVLSEILDTDAGDVVSGLLATKKTTVPSSLVLRKPSSPSPAKELDFSFILSRFFHFLDTMTNNMSRLTKNIIVRVLYVCHDVAKIDRCPVVIVDPQTPWTNFLELLKDTSEKTCYNINIDFPSYLREFVREKYEMNEYDCEYNWRPHVESFGKDFLKNFDDDADDIESFIFSRVFPVVQRRVDAINEIIIFENNEGRRPICSKYSLSGFGDFFNTEDPKILSNDGKLFVASFVRHTQVQKGLHHTLATYDQYSEEECIKITKKKGSRTNTDAKSFGLQGRLPCDSLWWCVMSLLFSHKLHKDHTSYLYKTKGKGLMHPKYNFNVYEYF